MMRTPFKVAVGLAALCFGSAFIFAATETDAHACSIGVDPCQIEFAPGAGLTVPGNAPGFLVDRPLIAPSNAGYESAEILRADGSVIPSTTSRDANSSRLIVLPDRALSPGAYRLVARVRHDAECANRDAGVVDDPDAGDGGAGDPDPNPGSQVVLRHEQPFNVGPESTIPASIGTVTLGPRLDNNGIATFRVRIDLTSEARAFLPLLTFTMALDGQPRFAAPVGNLPEFELKVVCNPNMGVSSCESAQPAGKHTLKVEAVLPGHPEKLTAAQINADLSCDGVVGSDAGPSGSGGNNSGVSAGCACNNVSSTSTPAILGGIVLGLVTALAVRRRRR